LDGISSIQPRFIHLLTPVTALRFVHLSISTPVADSLGDLDMGTWQRFLYGKLHGLKEEIYLDGNETAIALLRVSN